MLGEDDPNGHVNFMTFGLEAEEDRSRFHGLIVNTKKMDAYTAILALREVYETHYGIFDHDAPGLNRSRPLALAAMHPKEDTFTYSLEHRFMWRFRQYEICKNWGYDLTQFLNLPWYMTMAIFAIEQKRAADKLREEEEARRKQEMEERKQQSQAGLRHDIGRGRYVPTSGNRRR